MSSNASRVLIVYDDDVYRVTLIEALSLRGWQGVGERNGHDAIMRLKDDTDFCAVIIDQDLPDRGCWEFRAQQLREARMNDIPLLVLVGERVHSTAVSDQLRALAFLPKSVETEMLVECLELICASSAPWVALNPAG